MCPTPAAVAERASRLARLAIVLSLLVRADAALGQDLTVTLKERALQPGEAVVAVITAPAGTTTVSIEAFGATWPAFQVSDSTWRALLGIDLDQKAGTYELTAASAGAGEARARQAMVVVARSFRRRALTVAPDYVNPPPDILSRITQEAAFLRAAYERSDTEPAWRDGFVRPVPGNANSSFGTRSVFNGEARAPHAGTDFLSGAGTPIHAPSAGHIVAARDLFFTGNTIIIDHGAGVFSMLAHLSRLDVREGDTVKTGDIVGLVGATGRVTGPHLHWALRIGAARVDPLSALAVMRSGR